MKKTQIDTLKNTEKLIAPETLKAIAYNYDMDYYFKSDNLQNQNEVLWMYIKFDCHCIERDNFERIDFFNIVWRQYNFIVENINNPDRCISTLKGLPLSDLQRHIIIGYVLEFFRYFPLKHIDYDCTTIRLIRFEFRIKINHKYFSKKYFYFCSRKKASTYRYHSVLDKQVDRTIEYLENKAKTGNDSIPCLETPVKESKTIPESNKPFPAFLIHQQKIKLAEALRTEFSTEKGKAIRLMIEALKDHTPTLIAYHDREKKALYESMKVYLNRDIATYNAVFQCDYYFDRDRESLNSVSARIDHILQNL